MVWRENSGFEWLLECFLDLFGFLSVEDCEWFGGELRARVNGSIKGASILDGLPEAEPVANMGWSAVSTSMDYFLSILSIFVYLPLTWSDS